MNRITDTLEFTLDETKDIEPMKLIGAIFDAAREKVDISQVSKFLPTVTWEDIEPDSK